MTKTINIYTVIGDTVASASEIAYTTPLIVKRRGIEYDIIYTGTPGDRQVKYTTATGDLEFKVPFERGEGVLIRNIGEDIFVMYKL